MAAVVEQSINSFLQHPFFVANDDVRSLEQEQVFETVIAINNPTIKIVKVRSRKTPAFQWNKRTQIRRDDRQHIENHPLGTCVRVLESLDELEALRQLLANLFALRGAHRLLQLFVELVQIDLGEKSFHGLGPHARDDTLALLLSRFTTFNSA